MRLALNNAALPAAGEAWLARLPGLGIAGVEIAPRATWRDPWYGLAAGAVEGYGRRLRRHGLACVGLRLDLDEEPGLGWLGEARAAKLALAHLAHLSAICRDLGGHTLVVAGPRWRHGLPVSRAWQRSRSFFLELLGRIEAHGTVLCLAPVGPGQGDFCNSANDCRILADAIEHPAFGLELSASALYENGEMGRHAVFAAHYGRLELFVADEPGGAPLGSGAAVDHAAMRRHLSAGGYRDWVCLAQARAGDAQLLASIAFLADRYRRRDNLSLALHAQRPA